MKKFFLKSTFPPVWRTAVAKGRVPCSSAASVSGLVGTFSPAHRGSSALEASRVVWGELVLAISSASSEVQDHPLSPGCLWSDRFSGRPTPPALPGAPRAKGEPAAVPPLPAPSSLWHWAACHFPLAGTLLQPFFPIQADNWASASAACCSASAFQQTAGASEATLGCATVIPQPPRASLAQYCALGSRMFLSPLHSCEFLYRLKRNLFLIFLRGRGWEERCLAAKGAWPAQLCGRGGQLPARTQGSRRPCLHP